MRRPQRPTAPASVFAAQGESASVRLACVVVSGGMAERVRLGELLVEAQMITREQLEEVLARQRDDGRRLGTLLVADGYVTETQVTQILSQQLSVPWVSLYHIDFSRQLLNLVPRDIAERYCLVPIFVRRVRGLGETLYVAMDDPTDDRAIDDVAKWSGLPVRSMIAPPADIRSAISVYYGGAGETPPTSLDADEVTSPAVPSARAEAGPPPKPAGRQAAEPADPPETAAAAEPEPSRAPMQSEEIDIDAAMAAEAGSEPADPVSQATPPSQDAGEEPPSDALEGDGSEAAPAVAPQAPQPGDLTPIESGETVKARDAAIPAPAKGGAKMVALTLLDGTTVQLPAHPGKDRTEASQKGEGGEEDQLTARDLVAALRAVSHGADASEILGENMRWELMFAALLNLLLKKHLIADWEFVDEFKRIR